MKTIKPTLPLLALAGLALAGCPGDDTTPPGDGSSGSSSTGSDPTTITTPMTMDTTAGTDPTAGTETGTTDPTEGSGTTTTGEDEFVFNETPFEDYTQVDRQGFPAVNSGLNLLGDKDAYNAASPADDANLMFVSNILESLETLHLGDPANQVPDNTGLDDDLTGLGLSPCVTPPMMMDTCDDQGAPFVLPDVIEINLDNDPGFPNGRQLDAPVMDIILAVILLDLQPAGPHPVTKFVDFDEDGTPGPSLNPLANDVEFEAGFPYLAAAH